MSKLYKTTLSRLIRNNFILPKNKQQTNTNMADDEIQVPQAIAELANASTPTSIKNIRACKRCGILKTLNQFLDGKSDHLLDLK